jgi:RNA polymerase sigma-70 factor (ECF subfamily)
MACVMIDDPTDLDDILDRATVTDDAVIRELFDRCHERLRRMVQFRLDRRLQGRIDASDVVQEAFLEASQRLEEFRRGRSMPVFLWLRFLVAERLTTLHRHHLGVQARDAARDVSLYSGPLPAASSAALAAQLVGSITSPSDAAVHAERALRLQEALNEMDPVDREVLSLRHFEQLSRSETAQVLGIEESAAGKRYLRALRRLKKSLADLDEHPGE